MNENHAIGPAITKERWAYIETRLSHPYGSVKLKCDGYEITAQVQKYKGLKYCVVVYVDGVYKGKWTDGKDVRAQKFHCKNTRHVWPAKQRAEAKKELSKRRLLKEMKVFWQDVHDKKYEFWVPFWTSSKSFWRHIRKTCTDIEVNDV